MIYALRKLIAFVFLGGMFWFIYQDLGNLGKPWFMHTLGLIAVAFAFFWLLIPMVVVWLRIRNRCAKNRERHARWLAEGGIDGISPRPFGKGRIASLASVGRNDRIFFHEKGTLYTPLSVSPSGGGAGPVRPGRPSDVAFPHVRQKCNVDQRTHCYFTGRGVAFAGKELDFLVPYAELKSFRVEPGGIIFEVDRGRSVARLAFTFSNPLVAADILRLSSGSQDPLRTSLRHLILHAPRIMV